MVYKATLIFVLFLILGTDGYGQDEISNFFCHKNKILKKYSDNYSYINFKSIFDSKNAGGKDSSWIYNSKEKKFTINNFCSKRKIVLYNLNGYPKINHNNFVYDIYDVNSSLVGLLVKKADSVKIFTSSLKGYFIELRFLNNRLSRISFKKDSIKYLINYSPTYKKNKVNFDYIKISIKEYKFKILFNPHFEREFYSITKKGWGYSLGIVSEKDLSKVSIDYYEEGVMKSKTIYDYDQNGELYYNDKKINNCK